MKNTARKERDSPVWGRIRDWLSDALLFGGMVIAVTGVYVILGLGAGLLAAGACMVAAGLLIGGGI